MRSVSAALVAVLLAVISPTTLLGQSPPPSASNSLPREITITGVFRPADGQPPSVAEAVTVSIYEVEQGGTALWQETQTVSLDERGRYSLLLGASQPDGIPRDVFASNSARWLATQFQRRGESEGPRVRLTSVPYALKAADAETLGGLPASDYLLRHHPGLSGAGSDTENSVAAPAGELPGTPNLLAKYVDANNVGPSAIFESGGFVGVGTSTPVDNLHVRFTNNTGNLTGVAVQNLANTATSYSGMLFYDQNGALGQFQGFNNVTHEYRINNIASGGSINFMLNFSSKFQVRPDGDVDIPGSIRTGGARFLYTFGMNNTFLGLNTGNVTMTGIHNTAIGSHALEFNTTGGTNTATGTAALQDNTMGDANVANGYSALANNTAGANNTATGTFALSNNGTGNFNTAIGMSALSANGSGSMNVAVGYQAGLASTTGSNNIYLGSSVVGGGAGESNAIYLGHQGTQTKTIIAGIRGITTGVADAVSVFIDSNGQLGTVNSSRRYKEDIQDMGEVSSRLMNLRPVTYRYHQPYADGNKPIDYGLIAEEVEEIYPDLVTHLASGEIETVQYQKINAMLLNEVQKQHRTIEDLKARLDSIERLLAAAKK